MEKLITIIGPTAVGKTKLAIDLARLLGTDIISGDSMLVYRNLNIGTAKPTLTEQQGIVHHMIDIIEPAAEFSVVDFQRLAADYIHQINRERKIPLLVGGTGLYIRALLEEYQFSKPEGDKKLRTQLENLAEERGNRHLHAKLAEVQPEVARRLHFNDRRRIIRALEVFYTAGDQVSDRKAGGDHLKYQALVIGLELRRDILYQRINHRVDEMISCGLVEEVKQLLRTGLARNSQAMQGIGYKEIAEYLAGECTLAEAEEKIKKATRHFAKRQLTWFKNMHYVNWFNRDNFKDYHEMLAAIYKLVAGKFNLR